jgi:hypothetical protein
MTVCLVEKRWQNFLLEETGIKLERREDCRMKPVALHALLQRLRKHSGGYRAHLLLLKIPGNFTQ